MTGYSKCTIYSNCSNWITCWSLPTRIILLSTIVGGAFYPSLPFRLTAPVALAEDSPALTETSLINDSPSDLSDRESRLRNIEDELLKQLSVGSTSIAQEKPESNPTSIKHSPNAGGELQAIARQQSETASARSETPPAREQPTPRVIEPSRSEPSTIERVDVPEGRSPRPATVVPITTSTVPRRTPRIKRTSSEKLSSADLEHRLAIAEAQITLLNKELENAKTKLAQSEANSAELTRQIEDGATSQPVQSASQESTVRYREISSLSADDSDGVDTQTDSYSTTARVTKNNTPLRLGPGSRESAIMRLSRNSIVTIEHRTGGWYRIATTDGTRGWVSGSALIFDEGRSPRSTIRVGAFEPQLEVVDGR